MKSQFALHQGTSFPVGKVNFIDLYPLSFKEFLMAIGEERFSELITKKEWATVTIFHEKLMERLKQYFYIGGMPEAVLNFSENQDYNSVRKIQKDLLDYYQQDFSKHAPSREVPRINLVWNSVGLQLAKENKKFFYGQIKKGARASEFEIAIQWLTDCGLIHTVNRISKPAYPLKAYVDFGAFKMFMLDIGLLCAQNNIDTQTIIDGNKLFTEFKGALAEQFVLQELISNQAPDVFYYSTETARGKIDFIIQQSSDILPIEVKAGETVKHAQSLKAFHEKYQPANSIRISGLPYTNDSWLTNIPLYAVSEI